MLNRQIAHRFVFVFLTLLALLLWLLCMHWFAVSLYELLDTLRFLLSLARKA